MSQIDKIFLAENFLDLSEGDVRSCLAGRQNGVPAVNKIPTATVRPPNEAFTPMLLTDYAQRRQQLRITCNKLRLALSRAVILGGCAALVHR